MPKKFAQYHGDKAPASKLGLAARSPRTAPTTFKIRRVPALDLDLLNESIRQVKAFSMARRASDELTPELMSMPVNV